MNYEIRKVDGIWQLLIPGEQDQLVIVGTFSSREAAQKALDSFMGTL